MSENLTHVRLGDVADIVMGQSPDSSACNSDEVGIPFLQGCAEFGRESPSTSIYCSPPLRVSKAEAILISVRAPVGKMNWGDQRYCIGRGLGAITAKAGEQADTRFLYYALEENVSFLHRRSQGSTFLAISANDLNIFPVPRYHFNVQKKISRILHSVDQAIEKTEALIEKYQQVKAGLMHDLFTRGITADGKLRPSREQAPELYQETAIGWITKDWRCVPASELCFPITKGTTPAFFDNTNKKHSIPYLRVENLSFDGSLRLKDDGLFVSKQVHNTELFRSKVFPGDILMNIVGPPLGKLSLIPDTYPEWNANQAVSIYRVLDQIHTKYLLFYLLSEFAQKWFLARSKQTSGQVNLTLEMCSNIEIPVPNSEIEVTRIADKISSIFEQINVETKYLNKLRIQKSGLMQDLLTGKVTVPLDKEPPHV